MKPTFLHLSWIITNVVLYAAWPAIRLKSVYPPWECIFLWKDFPLDPRKHQQVGVEPLLKVTDEYSHVQSKVKSWLRRTILWELLLMWFQQTPKMSQGEQLAYISRKREREGGAEWKRQHVPYVDVWVLASISSKYLRHDSQFSLKSLSGVDMTMNEGEEDEGREIDWEKTERWCVGYCTICLQGYGSLGL